MAFAVRATPQCASTLDIRGRAAGVGMGRLCRVEGRSAAATKGAQQGASQPRRKVPAAHRQASRGTRMAANCRRERSGNDDVNRGVRGCMDKNPDEAQKVEILREQAARCRRLARHTSDREIELKLVELAQEFERRAAKLETGKRCI